MALGLSLRITNITAKIAAVVTTGLQMWHKMTADTWTGSDRLPDSSDNTNTAAMYTGRGFDHDGVNDFTDVGNAAVSCKSIVLYIYPATTTESILQLTASIDVNIATGTLTGTGWTSPTEYVDGAATDVVAATTYQQVAITSATGFTVDDLEFGRISSTYYDGIISNVKIFDIELSAGQVAELYANPEQVLPTGATAANLVGWWPMVDGDSAGIVLDGSGNGNQGTISGATEVFSLPSPVNQPALKGHNLPMWFDGSDDDITGSATLPDTEGTIIAWVLPTGISGGATQPVFIMGSASAGNMRGITILDAGNVRFNGWSADVDSLTTLTNKSLYSLAATWNGSGDIELFINGLTDNTGTVTLNSSGTNTFNIGAGPGGFINFPGGVFMCAYFNSVLTAAEITEIYSGGINFDLTADSGDYASSADLQGYWKNTGNTDADWLDLSTNSNDGTVSGSPVTIYIPEGITAGTDILGTTITNANTGEIILNADGYTETADDATLDITDELTLEAWIKPFSVATEQTIIGKDLAYALKITSGAKPAFSKYTTTETETATTSTTLSVDTWYHLAATYDGVNVRIYINGAIDTTTAVSGAIDTNASVLLTGALTSSTEKFDGYIDSAKVYDGTVLSADEILQNYNAEIADHA